MYRKLQEQLDGSRKKLASSKPVWAPVSHSAILSSDGIQGSKVYDQAKHTEVIIRC